MKKEQIILYFIATLIGLLVAGTAFYFYQSTKTVSSSKAKTISLSNSPTPTPNSSIFLTLNTPKDEEVVSKKIIDLSGKTANDASIIILTLNSEEVVSPSGTGDFSTTLTLSDGQNLIEVTAIAPNGEEAKITRTVTYSTEEF